MFYLKKNNKIRTGLEQNVLIMTKCLQSSISNDYNISLYINSISHCKQIYKVKINTFTVKPINTQSIRIWWPRNETQQSNIFLQNYLLLLENWDSSDSWSSKSWHWRHSSVHSMCMMNTTKTSVFLTDSVTLLSFWQVK